MNCGVTLQLPSKVEKVAFRGLPYFIKRDDQIHPLISGNKARKLKFLLNYNNTPKRVVYSFGGVQSNMLSALAVVCQLKQWDFCYYTKKKWYTQQLLSQPEGNLKVAMEYGAKVIQVEHKDWGEMSNTFKKGKRESGDSDIYVMQGAHQPEAEEGVKELADEIIHWHNNNNKDNNNKLSVFVASGTGTTAVYLSKHLHPFGIQVITCPLVGSPQYLLQQITDLVDDVGFPNYLLPKIVDTPKSYGFGKLYGDFWDVGVELKKEIKHIVFDWLYDPKGWIAIDIHRKTTNNNNNNNNNVMYIHCGGILGNATMLKRYNNNEI